MWNLSIITMSQVVPTVSQKSLQSDIQRNKPKKRDMRLKLVNFLYGIGKAQAGGHTDGFVKVIFDAKYGEWLGCHMIGLELRI